MQQIREYLLATGLGYVQHLPLYPEEEAYLQINLYDTTISVEKGHDAFHYNGYRTVSKRKYWYVVRDNNLYIEKGFTCYKSAIKAVLLKQQKQLAEELEITNTIIGKL